MRTAPAEPDAIVDVQLVGAVAPGDLRPRARGRGSRSSRRGGERMRYVDEFRDAELGRAVAAEIARDGRRRPSLQGHGGVRRAHALHLQVRRRRPAAAERRARARPGLPRLRDPDGARGRRHRGRPRARGDLHVLRRHAARPRRRTGRCSTQRRTAPTCAWSTRRSMRCGSRARTPIACRVLRHRLRDDRALDGPDAAAGEGRGHRELPLPLQPRHDRAAVARAARVAGPAAGRLHRARPCRHGRRRPSVRVHPERLRQADRGSPGSSRSTSCSRCR